MNILKPNYIFIILIISLIIALIFYKPTCDKVHLNDWESIREPVNLYEELKLWDKEDAVPDEETAIKIAEIIIERQKLFNDLFELGYDVNVDFDEIFNEWIITYTPIAQEGSHFLGGQIKILIRRDCGAITGLGVIP